MTHNEILKALSEGKQLQESHPGSHWWDMSAARVLRIVAARMQSDVDGHECTFRVRPEPKPDVVLWGCIGDCWSEFFDKDKQEHDNVQAIINGETGKLKSVRMLGKPCPEKMETVLRKMTNHTFTSQWWDEIQEVLKP